jgi:dienelactone hydrolase
MFRSTGLRFQLIVLVIFFSTTSFATPNFAASKKNSPTKSVRGRVTDSSGKPIGGAKIFLTKVSKKTTTVVVTDEQGQYAIHGLESKDDYEVHAEFGPMVSEKRMISQFLTRLDNLFNFELNPGKEHKKASVAKPEAKPVEIKVPNGSLLHAEWWLPEGTPPKGFPAVFLLHDFGKDLAGWNEWIPEIFLSKGYAVLNVDLWNPGPRPNPEGAKSSLDLSGKEEPARFLPEIGAVLEWLRQQEKIDSDRIAVAGCGLGADLAFLASGKFEQVRAAIALSPVQAKTARQADSIANFQPHTILYLAAQGDAAAVSASQAMEAKSGYPRRTQIIENSSASGLDLLKANADLIKLIDQWLGNSL